MMRVVGCPSCEQNLAVDEFIPAAAIIQCPFCQADHALSDMAQARLPLAIVLEMPAVEVAEDALDDQPLGDDGELRGAIKFGSGDAATGSASGEQGGEQHGDSDELKVAADDPSGAISEAGESTSEVGAEEAEAGAGGEASTDDSDVASAPAAAIPRSLTKRRRKRGPSMVALMVQVVLGGVIGIGGTILGLLWLPGSLRRDPFNVGYDIGKVAPWIVPAQYRPDATASGSGDEGKAKTANSRSTAQSSRKKLPHNSEDKANAVAEFPKNALERKAKELEDSLNGSQKDDSPNALDMPVPGSDDSTENAALEEDFKLELPDDSEEVVEEPTASATDDSDPAQDNIAVDEPQNETETTPATAESEPSDSAPTIPSDDTVPSDSTSPTDDASSETPAESAEPAEKEDDAKDGKEGPGKEGPGEEAPSEAKGSDVKEDEAAPTVPGDPVESLKPPVEETSAEEASRISHTLAKATTASEELTRVLADKELPLPQQREAAQSFYSALCGLSDVSAPAAVETLVKAATDRLHSQVIAQGAASFLDRAETVGKPLVVVGKVTSSKTTGPVTEIKINLAAKEPREVVLVTAASGEAPAQADDEIIAIGFLVDCDATPIEGYEGTGKVLSQSRVGRLPAPAAP